MLWKKITHSNKMPLSDTNYLKSRMLMLVVDRTAVI